MIRRYLWIILLLFAIPCYALNPFQAFMMSAGASGAAACSETTPNSQTTNNDVWFLGSEEGKKYLQSPYVAAGYGTYTVKTLYVKLLKIGSPTFTITAQLCATNNGTTTLGTCTSADATLDASTLTESAVDYKFNFSSGYSQTNGTTYHVKLFASAVGDTSNYVRWTSNSSYASPGCYYHADGTGTYNINDTTCQHDFILKNCLE